MHSRMRSKRDNEGGGACTSIKNHHCGILNYKFAYVEKEALLSAPLITQKYQYKCYDKQDSGTVSFLPVLKEHGSCTP